jgi:hypothetical protein
VTLDVNKNVCETDMLRAFFFIYLFIFFEAAEDERKNKYGENPQTELAEQLI